MTVLTKFGLSEKKDQLPLVEANSPNEAKIDVTDAPSEDLVQNFIIIRKRPVDPRLNHICCLLVVALLVLSIGVLGGTQMYLHYNRPKPHHFQGWCAIPYDNPEPRLIEPHFRIMTMPQNYFPVTSRDVELLEDLPKDEQLFATPPNYLKETFEIGDDYEKIFVSDYRDSRHGNVLHDFSSNVSGIVDMERCFVMPMNPSLVMQPRVFVYNIQGHSQFDLSTVHDAMRAVIPALIDLTNMGYHIEKECADRPTYMLEKEEGTIRKRSADIPENAKFAQFSGKHIQEIDVVNIKELLAYEEKTSDAV